MSRLPRRKFLYLAVGTAALLVGTHLVPVKKDPRAVEQKALPFASQKRYLIALGAIAAH